MNGAEALLRTARDAGLEVCFANPGTTEMQLVGALDSVPGFRAVLGLFEGVCTGAADGYARMTGRAALTLLHLGPGFANGIANLHNARRAGSPVVNLVGDHARWHLAADAPLTSDIESLARPVGWVRAATAPETLSADLADAIAAAHAPWSGPATLVVPQDLAWEDSVPAAKPRPPATPRGAAPQDVEAAARRLRAGGAAALFLGGRALGERGLRAAARIASATGCRVVHETFFSRLERGGGLPAFERLPYFPEQARAALEGLTDLVLAGTGEPMAFFGYPQQPSRLAPEHCAVSTLAAPDQDAAGALESLADQLGGKPGRAAPGERPAPPAGRLDAEALGRAVAALQPQDAIVVDEAATSGLVYYSMASAAPRHTLLTLTGGAIGQGLPCAVGAAVACPTRKVIAFQADGSGMYTLQSLWTMARESLDVTIVVCANRKYRILEIELARAGIENRGRNARALTDLSRPPFDWVSLARGMGVPGVSVDDADGLVSALRSSLGERGPSLVEARL